MSSAVIGGEKLPYYSLKLWHGFTPALYMSVVATLGGLFLLALHRRGEYVWNALPRPEAKVIFEAVIGALTRLSRWITDTLHNGVISRYAIILIAFTVGLGYYAYTTGTIGPETRVADCRADHSRSSAGSVWLARRWRSCGSTATACCRWC